MVQNGFFKLCNRFFVINRLLRMVSNPVISGQIGNTQTEKYDITNDLKWLI